jgi:hypothetical protein
MFEKIIAFGDRPFVRLGNRLAAAAALAIFAASSCQTSVTPQPACPPGQHAVHAPSHQGHVWDCAPD